MRSNGVGWYYFNTVTGDVKTDRSLMLKKESSGMTRTVSEPHGLNDRVEQQDKPARRSVTPTTSRRPSTASARGTRMMDMAEDALRVFGIKNKAMRRSSKASLVDRQPQQTMSSPFQTKHANASIGGGDVDAVKRISAGSIPTRSSSRMSLQQVPPRKESLVTDESVEPHDPLDADRMMLQVLVENVQRHIDESVRAAERHLLALQTPDQTLASLSLDDDDAASSPPDVPVSARPSAIALRESVTTLVPLIRQLVYSTRHALLGLEQVIRASLPPSGALAYVSPEDLHHPQRRLVAALSKVIFFTHSAAATDWPLGGTAERLALDTRDLAAVVGAYVEEVGRIGCLRPEGKGLKREPQSGDSPPEGQTTLDGATIARCRSLVQVIEGFGTVTLDSAQTLVDQLDSVFDFLRNLDVLAVLDIEEDSPEVAGWNEYASCVSEARARYGEYSDAVRDVHQIGGDLLLAVLEQDDAALQPTADRLSSVHAIPTHLEKLLGIATRQAQDVPPKLAHRIGAQARKAERTETPSARSSRSVSIDPTTRYNPSDYHSRSQASFPMHSISRTGSISGSRMSASSSVTSLSQTDDFYNYRNSGSGFESRSESIDRDWNKSDPIAERSTSINKKKLAKMLGEDEFGENLFTQFNRPMADEKPHYLKVDYADDDIIINPDGSVKAGTLPALVERLTLHESMGKWVCMSENNANPFTDPTFNSTFLMTYRSFATAEEVLQLLVQRYQLAPPRDLMSEELKDWAERKQKPVKLRFVQVAKLFCWLTRCSEYSMCLKHG